MTITFRELEKIIKNDGWRYKNTIGSHCHYVHDIKLGKVTIPKHKEIKPKTYYSILKQAGLK